ncbi:EamA family transporter RarD [Roseibacterium sp. SDUM158017]|uniref:EamA family transporter RarD n=1 Tax=Roseicyclus salinarum TaxID=3036773 RepID=UPI00241512D3|nr:EamA family transporter RarD [Roseibacterium sp. SDUM158017]MDG4648054.1 EamA family transporter RarD [Roseibacterium sp. SDUM158017]
MSATADHDAAPAIRTSGDTPAGFGFAVSAYVLWGGLPLYMKAIEHIPAVEIIAHRILWSVPVAGLVLVALGRTADLGRALRDPRMVGMAALTAAMISLNWGVYVWAIANDHTLDAALGYYINPLFSVALGAIVLREKLSAAQWSAVGLAVVAVAILTVAAGKLPWVALVLMTSFGIYGYLRKTLPIGPNQGFLLEVLLLSPFAALYMVWLGPEGHFLTTGAPDTLLLLGCGVVTAIPLILYANGAKGLKLSTIGILQYIAPTLIFLVAVFVFGEPFGPARAVAFPLIWLALVIYTVSMVRTARAARAA